MWIKLFILSVSSLISLFWIKESVLYTDFSGIGYSTGELNDESKAY